MNRIYLKPRKNRKGCFWIKDILDDKKLGKVLVANNENIVKPKSKYKGKLIETEALLLIYKDINISLIDTYKHYLKIYINDNINIKNYNFPLFFEACRLKPCENDMFDRPTQLHPTASKAWEKIKTQASKDNIDLQIISAYRSLEYQEGLINNKLDKGIDIKDILKVNTLPGYSEHHTGCAIDIGSKGEPILEETFDQSDAFKWLEGNAKDFNFYMSYPKGNTTGICYEPWHWCFKPKN